LSQHDSTPPTLIRGDGDGFALDLEFSEPLRPGSLTHGNWSWRVAGTTFDCFDIIVSGNRLFMQGVDLAPQPGVDIINYSAAVPDVLDLAGNPLAPIVAQRLNFP
jgi:hypothetical protein